VVKIFLGEREFFQQNGVRRGGGEGREEKRFSMLNSSFLPPFSVLARGTEFEFSLGKAMDRHLRWRTGYEDKFSRVDF
jgi:hypothetical protein